MRQFNDFVARTFSDRQIFEQASILPRTILNPSI